MNRIVRIGAGRMESILNEGLCVLFFSGEAGPGEGESFVMEEVNGDTPTGRRFFARVMHAIDPQIIQFTLASYMEVDGERFPMAGSFANEEHTLPDKESPEFFFNVTGEKPVWLYAGIKWVAELSLVKLLFKRLLGRDQHVPDALHLKVQASGGERYFVYRFEREISPGEA